MNSLIIIDEHEKVLWSGTIAEWGPMLPTASQLDLIKLGKKTYSVDRVHFDLNTKTIEVMVDMVGCD